MIDFGNWGWEQYVVAGYLGWRVVVAIRETAKRDWNREYGRAVYICALFMVFGLFAAIFAALTSEGFWS